MHLLITNDDGVSSVGLKALADAAMRRGHRVFISTPNGQRSANSQHITLTAPIIVHQHAWEGAEAYAVDGTPSDCVRVAPFLANAPFDFCLSGINHGENAGPAVYYSGTVAAAREAAMLHIPAMAVSIMVGANDEMRAHLADLAVRLAEHFAAESLPRCTLINLNAPALPPAQLKPLKVCPVSEAYFLDCYEKRQSPFGATYFWLSGSDTSEVVTEPLEPGSDYAFLKDGHVTCTFMGAYQNHNDQFIHKMKDFQE